MAHVRAKRGWVYVTIGPVTVAVAPNEVYYGGDDLGLVKEAVRMLGL